jgi:RNA polymerase sigma-70 factor (ECF subfamily)
MAAHADEDGWMAAYARGERRAFERLFARLAPRVHAFFLRSFDRATADDLLQVTFLKVHRARGGYEAGRPVRAWIFTIAARVRLDEWRRRGRLAENAGEEELAKVDEMRAAESDPRSGENRNDVIESVRAALETLPETQRVVVHLHRYEGMTFAEIATLLGTTEGAIKLRAFRAYEALRKQLAGLVSREDAA